jgi:hypothetical protein
MGKVVFNMTVSLDGFVAGPNDSPENGLGDGGDQLFKWYFSGDTEIPISDGNMVLKVSPQSAEILKEALGTYGAGVWGRRTFDIAHGWGGHPPGSPFLLSPIPFRRNGSKKYRRSPLSLMGLKAPFVWQKKPRGTRMSSYAPPASCSSASTRA